MPEPTPNDRRPTPVGQEERPLRAAPPLPGAGVPPAAREQRLAPAPPVPASPASGSGVPERPLPAAPLPVRPASVERPLPAAPAVPAARPVRQETPLPAATGEPIGRRPEVPVARPAPVRGAQPISAAPLPAAPLPAAPLPAAPLPAWGSTPISGSVGAAPAAYAGGGPAELGGAAAGRVGQPQVAGQAGQAAPPDHPAWFQPPAAPPPVPPPGIGSQSAGPPSPRPLEWTPHSRSGPVGSRVAAALDGGALPVAKTRTARSLRRQSRLRSSMLAVTFLLVAATFLVGMVIVLLVSLTR